MSLDVKSQLDQLSDDQREEFEERAAIMEYTNGFSRERAEELALERITYRVRKFGPVGGNA